MGTEQLGHGALQSPPDERDLVVSPQTLERLASAVSLPATYRVPGRPPVTNQGATPQCVAYSAAYEQNQQDREEHGRFFDLHEAAFFYSIGGNDNGAVMRYALERMRIAGYPEQDSTPNAAMHRIEGYFAVPKTSIAIKQAIVAFGGVLVIGPWWASWEHPIGPDAVLPAAGGSVNGHAWWAVGWDEHGIIGQQTWGTAWGAGGLFRMPWHYVLNVMWEVWKTADEVRLEQVARAVITETGPGNYLRKPKQVLGEDAPKLEGRSIWGQVRKAGIWRVHDKRIVATPYDKPFKFGGFHPGARHGIGRRPTTWAELGIAGTNVAIPAPLVRLVQQ